MPSKTVRPWSRPARLPQQSRAAHAGSGRHRGALTGLRTVVTGGDASPHLTGVAGFSTAVGELIEARRGLVEHLQPATAPARSGDAAGEPVDLVIAVSAGPGAAAAAVLADRHDAPLLVLEQASSAPARASGGTVGEVLTAKLDRALSGRADRWAATSEAAREQLLADGVEAGRIDLLPYWSAAEPPADQRAATAARSRARTGFGWPAEDFVVTCPVGADLDDVGELLLTAEVLTRRESPVRLIVIGRGGRLRRLREDAGPGAGAIYEVTGAQYPATFAAADLALLPIAEPATGGRVASSLAAGTPIVTTTGTAAAVPELAAAEEAVVQVHAGTAEQLADALETLAAAEPARALLAAAARSAARELLDPARAADQLEATVTATLAARPR